MTSETRKIIADGIAEKMDTDELVRQKEKTNDRTMVRIIAEELQNRNVCPECQNDMMVDESNNENYCPLGHHSHTI